MLVLVIASELELTSKPLLVRGEKAEATVHIIKYSIFDILTEIIHVEKATKISMVA